MRPGVDLRHAGTLSAALALLLLPAPAAVAREAVRLVCEPRTFEVVAGQPVRAELTVEADSADPIRLRIPADPALVLRAVEKPPVRRTRDGVIVHRRGVIWQALRPGIVKLTDITVETRGQKWNFPEITIRVREAGP